MANVYVNELKKGTVKTKELRIESKQKRTVRFEVAIDDQDAKSQEIHMVIKSDSPYDILLDKQFSQVLAKSIGNGSLSFNRVSNTEQRLSWKLNQRAGLVALNGAFAHYETTIKRFLENHER